MVNLFQFGQILPYAASPNFMTTNTLNLNRPSENKITGVERHRFDLTVDGKEVVIDVRGMLALLRY